MTKTYERVEHIHIFVNNIDKIIKNLQNISKLEDCATVCTGCTTNIDQEACLKHEKALNNLSIKWWQNLERDN